MIKEALITAFVTIIFLAWISTGILAVDASNRHFTQADREIIAHQRTVMANRYCEVGG